PTRRDRRPDLERRPAPAAARPPRTGRRVAAALPRLRRTGWRPTGGRAGCRPAPGARGGDLSRLDPRRPGFRPALDGRAGPARAGTCRRGVAPAGWRRFGLPLVHRAGPPPAPLSPERFPLRRGTPCRRPAPALRGGTAPALGTGPVGGVRQGPTES